jgi:hypothetical protein
MALHSLGQVESDSVKARALIQEALATNPEANGLSEREYRERALLAWRHGDYATVRQCLVREMEIARNRDNRMGVAFALESYLASPDLDPLLAGRLFGAVSVLNAALGINSNPRLDRMYQILASQVESSALDAVILEGTKLTWEQAVDEVSHPA